MVCAHSNECVIILISEVESGFQSLDLFFTCICRVSDIEFVVIKNEFKFQSPNLFFTSISHVCSIKSRNPHQFTM